LRVGSVVFLDFVLRREQRAVSLTPVGNETAKGSGGTTQVQFAKNVNIDAAGVKLARTSQRGIET